MAPITLGYNIRISNDKEPRSITSRDSVLMDSAWPMYCHDVRHTSRSQYSTISNPYDEKWWFKTTHEEYYDEYICFINIGSDGTIYFTDVGGFSYALYPNGTLKWIYEFDFHGLNHICSHPAVDNDGNLYVGSYYDDFYAINPDGTLKWEYNFKDSIYSSPVIDDDGIIYFATSGDDGGIYAFYPNGTIKWEFITDEKCYSSPAIDSDGIVYVGLWNGVLYSLYPNGELRWMKDLKEYHAIYGSPSIADDGTVYVPLWGYEKSGFLYAVNPDDGSVKWDYEIDMNSKVTPSIGEDGTIYLISSGKLYAINPDGTKKWIRNIGLHFSDYSTPAISADGTIFAVAYESIFEFRPDGTKRWSETFDIPTLFIESSPVIGEDGTIYLALGHWKEIEFQNKYQNTLYFHAFNMQDQNAPSTPEITGPTKGESGERYDYTIVSTAPNDDDIYYYVSWGVPSYEIPMSIWVPSVIEEYGPYFSGAEITINHTWLWDDIYTIKVRAQDTNNLVSSWGTLEVNLPRTKTSYDSLLLRFLEQFPLIMEVILRLIR